MQVRGHGEEPREGAQGREAWPSDSLWTSMTFSMDRTALALGLCCRTFSGRGSSCKTCDDMMSMKDAGCPEHQGVAARNPRRVSSALADSEDNFSQTWPRALLSGLLQK